MTDWIDFAVCATFLFAYWFVLERTRQSLAVPTLEDRNADWVAAHPEIIRRIAKSRWRLWLSYALGTVSLGALAGLQLGLWEWTRSPMRDGSVAPKWMTLLVLTIASMFVWMVTIGGIKLHDQIARNRLVPVAARRQATLERRSLADFIPPWMRRATYTLVGTMTAVMIYVPLSAAVNGKPWKEGAFITAVALIYTGICFSTARFSVARRAVVADRIFGPGYRRWEVRFFFSMQIVLPIFTLFIVYANLGGTNASDFFRLFSLILLGYSAWFVLRVSWLPVDRDGTSSGRLVVALTC